MPVKSRLAFVIDDEETEVLRQQRPLVGRALEIDDEVVLVGVDRIGHHRHAARGDRLLQRPPDHQIHGRAPVQRFIEQLEDEALVLVLGFLPQVLAIADETRALAALDHLGKDVHVGGELARLGAVACALVDAELSAVEVGDPDVDDEVIVAVAHRLSGDCFRNAGDFRHLGARVTGCVASCGIGPGVNPGCGCGHRLPPASYESMKLEPSTGARQTSRGQRNPVGKLHGLGRVPKMALPTRTCVAPNCTAVS